jgi:hypothetical protein
LNFLWDFFATMMVIDGLDAACGCTAKKEGAANRSLSLFG